MSAALEKVTELVQRLRELDAQRDAVTAELNEIKSMLGVTVPTHVPQRRNRTRSVTARREGGFRRGTTVFAAQEALRFRGQPVHIDQLVDDIRSISGIRVEKASLVGNISRYVRQGVVFTRPSEGMYGLFEFGEDEAQANVGPADKQLTLSE